MQLLELENLYEGGNVFKTAEGKIETKRIDLKDIKPTLKALEQILKIPLESQILGSVGKKKSSGDIDLSIDPYILPKDQLIKNLNTYVKSINGGDPANWIKKSGITIHFKMPIRNNPRNGYVQVDFMFHAGGEEEDKWLKFSMYSAGDASQYSGADRNLLMSSIAKAQGLKYSWQKGLIRREDEAPISKDPDEIARRLLGSRYDGDVFLSVEAMQEAIHQLPQLQAKFKTLVQDLAEPVDKSGIARKPGEMRKNQEEVARITRLTGIN